MAVLEGWIKGLGGLWGLKPPPSEINSMLYACVVVVVVVVVNFGTNPPQIFL